MMDSARGDAAPSSQGVKGRGTGRAEVGRQTKGLNTETTVTPWVVGPSCCLSPAFVRQGRCDGTFDERRMRTNKKCVVS